MRFTRAVLASLVGAALGWFGGRVWYALFGSHQFGYEFEGVAEILIGTLIGTIAGGVIGWLEPWRRGVMTTAAAMLVSATAAVLFATGLVYVGAWTDADGPSGIAPFVGILGLPAGPLLIMVLRRHLRS